ncbi:VMAP-C domain-containing protein [Streptomyces aureoverticillatus]|uniref:VMAP-C domain-containing protein n=1 Tax=Streptomyces aureoverticillatus TaxID=66871 RepID=UPI001EF97351|nr:hypothetical protein [Streptomyces aureoverticillatus]
MPQRSSRVTAGRQVRQPAGRPAKQRVLAALVEVLGTSMALVDARGRQQWVRELTEEFPGLEIEGLPTPRQEFVEVVRHCSRIEDGLERLTDVTEFLAPALSSRLRPLLDEWYAAELYEGRDWAALCSGLEFTLPELPSLVAEVSGDRVRMPSYCHTAWHAFVHLAGHNAPVGRLEPSMVLLEHLMLRAEAAAIVGEIRAWNDHFADVWERKDGSAGLDALRARLAAEHGLSGGEFGHTAGDLDGLHDESAIAGEPVDRAEGADQQVPVIRMFIKIAPDLRPSDRETARQGRREARYRISSRVRYAESVRLHHEDCDPVEAVPRSRLPAAIGELLSTTAELWQSRDENVVLEFFLPAELLNEPVEWWNREPQLSHSNPLLSKYPWIFAHSLERMQRRDLHHAWRRRWARWKSDPGGGRVHWCDPGGRPAAEHLELLDAQIGKEEGVVCMVLSDSPRTRSTVGLRELRLGLDHGVPVVIFEREHAAPDVFRSMVKELLADEGLANLPERARQWKGDAAAGSALHGTGPHDKAVLKNLGMVWDDPQQLLDGDACAPAAFVGGTH